MRVKQLNRSLRVSAKPLSVTLKMVSGPGNKPRLDGWLKTVSPLGLESVADQIVLKSTRDPV